ncbi:MAG: LacI family transcriptional regulator [Rhodobacteraceae bacterium]|nr:LacI family transcriptional regulator [Paracoccaceae bacterium]
MKQRISTMQELSLKIGVSRPTLSKYFNDPESVRDSIRIRISQALSELDYVPNFFARNMNRKKTGLFGVVLPHMNDLFYMKLLQAIEEHAESLELSVIIQNSHGDPQKEVLALENLRSMNAEGVIISPVGAHENAAHFKQLHSQLPLVFVDARCPGLETELPFVGTDNVQSIGLITDYLCRSGTPPKFLSLPNVNSNAQEREQSYRSRISELGFTPVVLRTETCANQWEFEASAYQLMKDYFSRGKLQESTILCANDRLAMGVLRAANEASLMNTSNIGQNQLRVAGHDDHPLSSYFWPSLTTVSQDIVRIGETAFELVVDLARAPVKSIAENDERLFNAQLKLRASA